MKSPFTGGNAILQNERKSFEFRKEKIEIRYLFYTCCDTGERFTDSNLDEINISQVHNEYRVLYGIPFPDEIRRIRDYYGLSATKMSQILGFGVNMYGKYESGEIPNVSNGRMIKSCEDPCFLQRYFIDGINQFDAKEREAINKKIQKVKSEYNHYDNKVQTGILQKVMGESERSVYTGYVEPSLEKAKQMILFFAERLEPYLTKFNKLLFYADFVNFKKTGYGICGLSYRAIPYGPVPQKYLGLFQMAYELTEWVSIGDGDKIKASSGAKFNKELFTDVELESLNQVVERFKKISTTNIVEISHKELGWTENKDEMQLIPYGYAFDLKAI